MQEIKLSDNIIINDIKFAAKNSLDGRLVICIQNITEGKIPETLSLFLDKNKTSKITLVNNNIDLETWENFNILSNMFINIDCLSITIWMKQG